MSDLTIARVDDEPWNARPEPITLPAVVPILSIHDRVRRGIPIFSAPGVHAAFVYSPVGDSVRQEPCCDCGDLGFLTAWVELRYVGATSERQYKPVERAIDLCEACNRALEALPLGVRWQRSKERMAVVGRCIRALDSVGDTEAADALRAIQEGRR